MPGRGFLRSVGRWPTLLLLFAHCVATAGTGPSDKSLQPLLLTANVNGVAAEEPQLFVRDGEGSVLVSEAFLRHWKLRVPPQADTLFDEEKFFLLEASLPVRAKLSEADQSITIDAAGELFERQKTAFSNHELIGMTEPGKGFFMNYDMVFERTDKRISASGAFEVGVFHPIAFEHQDGDIGGEEDEQEEQHHRLGKGGKVSRERERHGGARGDEDRHPRGPPVRQDPSQR